MAGAQPGPRGLEPNPEAIDEGTSCRNQTPLPGPVGAEHGWAIALAHTTSLTGHASLEGSDTSTLQRLVVLLIGPQAFGLGVVYGMGENVVDGVVGLVQLARTFLLADLYDRAHQPAWMASIGPLGPVQRALAELSVRGFRPHLEEARAERDALIAELGYAITHPLEVLGNIGAEYAGKWRRFEELSRQETLSARFDAGRIFGEVLMDVLMLIGTGAAVVKAASKIPRLAKLARGLRGGRTGGARPAGAPTVPSGPAVTPSSLRPAAPAAEAAPAAGAAPATAPPKKVKLREHYLGRTPGRNSKTGLAVQERMRAEGRIRTNDFTGETEFQASNKNWYPLREADMSHRTDAVKWWNETGRHYGAKSPEVRKWMLDPDNYELDHFSLNRSAGGSLTEKYLPPTR